MEKKETTEAELAEKFAALRCDDLKEAKELMNTLDASNNVSLPNYVYDDQLRVYREVMPPANQIFKPVGFND